MSQTDQEIEALRTKVRAWLANDGCGSGACGDIVDSVLALLSELESLRAGLVEALDGWADRDSDNFDVDDRERLRAEVRP